MSFLRLLTTGKSWVNVKDSGRRFQMTDPRSMPKFGSEKNPMLAKKAAGQSVQSSPEEQTEQKDVESALEQSKGQEEKTALVSPAQDREPAKDQAPKPTTEKEQAVPLEKKGVE